MASLPSRKQDKPHLQVSKLRPADRQAVFTASATAVALVTDCCETATPCIATKQRLQMAQGVGPHDPISSQASMPVASLHTQRLLVLVKEHMRSVELQSGVVLQAPAVRLVPAGTTSPPGMTRPVLVPCAAHRLRLPRGTYGAAGELPGTVVELPRLHVGSKPAGRRQHGRVTQAGQNNSHSLIETLLN